VHHKNTIAIIGVPMDLGAGRRGVDMGPSAIRVAGLGARLAQLGYTIEDRGNVPVDQAESIPPGPKSARHLPQIAASCARVCELVYESLEQGKLPLVLGGDHSISAGSVSGVARFYRQQKEAIGVIWIDAHADMNTPETSPSGNVHGMPLSSLIGQGPPKLVDLAGFSPKVDPRNVAIIGLRDVDSLEAAHVRESGVRAFTMRDIDERGMPAIMQEAIALASAGTVGIHLSLDMDSIDPDEAPGVGTPVRGGLSYREAHLAMEILADSGKLISLEVVEVNPVLDIANRTADLAVEFITSALGKKIL
jgi:arginase